MKNLRSIEAFSLIELIVVVVIITVFAGLTFAYYYNFTQERNLDAEAKKLVDILDLAKRKTASGDSSMCNPAQSSTVDSYMVERTSPTTYRLIANCITGTAQSVTFTIPASSNVTITTAGGDQRVTFLTLTSGADPGCFKLQNSLLNPAKCRYVRVESGGVITENTANSCSG